MSRWEDNIKMHFKELGEDLIHLAQEGSNCGLLVNLVTNLRVPQKVSQISKEERFLSKGTHISVCSDYVGL
jgi:hypothetical protein